MNPNTDMNPKMVKCPVCEKMGYTDERYKINGTWPCTTHYLEMVVVNE